MSNLIRGNYIQYSQSDRVIIDSNVKSDNFNPLSFVKVEADLEADMQEEQVMEAEEPEEVIPDLEEVNQYAESIIKEAQAEAEDILASARAEAMEILNTAREQGHAEGYESGAAEIEVIKRQAEEEIKENLKRQEEACEKKVKQLEPQFADLTVKLVEKLTGIVVEDKKDLVMYLLSTALKPIRGPKQYLIRVSEHDAAIVTQRKEELAALLAEDCTLEIFEDSTLDRNQCFIETEDRLLDVSLDVQLRNLSEHLKMLANA